VAHAELCRAITAANERLASLAKAFPGVVALGGFCGGQPVEVLAYAPSREALHFSPVAMNRVQMLARIVASLPQELSDVFQLEINFARERRRLELQIVAREAALGAAAGEHQ
jgi:hypothetical protein